MTHYEIKMTTRSRQPWWAFWRPKPIVPFFTVLADGKPVDACRLIIHWWSSLTEPGKTKVEVRIDGKGIGKGDTAEVWRDGVIEVKLPQRTEKL